MNLDDAKACWQSQEQLAGVAMSDGQILEMVREESRAFDAKIRNRDLREILLMVVCAPFVLVTLLLPSSWVARAGALLVLASCALMYWKLRRARGPGIGLQVQRSRSRTCYVPSGQRWMRRSTC